MRIVVTGKSGQVTTALQVKTDADVSVIALGRPEFDLADSNSIWAALEAARPDVIVSAAAYTAVDKAESDTEQAFAVNRDGPGAVARAAASLGVPVIHLSTDYVFDGSKSSSYVEDDAVGPAGVYGASKLAGERAVAEASANHVILRTAWVYSAHGNNFVKTMLRLAETHDALNVVGDQLGCPTSAEDIADAVIAVAKRLVQDDRPALRGVYHLAGSGQTSWADFAAYIFSILEEKTSRKVNVNAITTEEYPTPAKRPANSRLDCSKLEANFGLRLPDWKISTRRVVETLLQSKGTIA